MQPFTIKSLLAILLAFACYGICYFLLNDKTVLYGWHKKLAFIGCFLPELIGLILHPI
jgi:hypothetical protein